MYSFCKSEVTLCRQSGKQVKTLKNKSYFSAPDVSSFSITRGGKVFFVDSYPSGRRSEKPPEEVQHCRFSTSRGAHYGQKFSLLNVERHVVQRVHVNFADAINLFKLFSA